MCLPPGDDVSVGSLALVWVSSFALVPPIGPISGITPTSLSLVLCLLLTLEAAWRIHGFSRVAPCLVPS